MRLIAPKGVVCAVWNGEQFIVDDDGIVEVPEPSVLTLTALHGFKLAPALPAGREPQKVVRMKA